METIVGFITEAGVLGLMIYFWRMVRKEQLVMRARFREMVKDRDYWKIKAEKLELKIYENP